MSKCLTALAWHRRYLHDVGLVSTGDALVTLLVSHVKGVAMDLRRAGPGDQTTTLSHIVGLHVFNAAVRVFNIFTDQRLPNQTVRLSKNGGCISYQINGYFCTGKDGIHAGKRLEHSLVGERLRCVRMCVCRGSSSRVGSVCERYARDNRRTKIQHHH